MNQYLLTCECGKKILVEAGQSGTALACVCGRTVEVPTMRELARLKSAPEARGKPEKPVWDWRQAVRFLGLLIVAGAVAFGVYEQLNRAKEADYAAIRREADDMDVESAWYFWRVFRNFGIELDVPRYYFESNPDKNPHYDPNLMAAANVVRSSLMKVQQDLKGDNESLHWIYIAGGIAVIGGVLIGVSYFWPASSGTPVKKHRARQRSA